MQIKITSTIEIDDEDVLRLLSVLTSAAGGSDEAPWEDGITKADIPPAAPQEAPKRRGRKPKASEPTPAPEAPPAPPIATASVPAPPAPTAAAEPVSAGDMGRWLMNYERMTGKSAELFASMGIGGFFDMLPDTAADLRVQLKTKLMELEPKAID